MSGIAYIGWPEAFAISVCAFSISIAVAVVFRSHRY